MVVEGVREIKGARQGPGNPRLGPGVEVGVTFTNPTQKSGGMTPETVTPSAGQGEAAVGWKGSHVGEGMALAKGFVLLGVESLSFQVDLTYRTHKACVMPAEAQGLQEAVPGIDLKVTASAFCAKHLLIVSLTVGHPFFHVEGPVPNGCLAGCAGEAMHVPSHLQGMHDFACDLFLALGTAGCVAHVIAGWAVDGTLLFEEAALFKDHPTLAAHKLLGVVRVAQCHQVTAPDDLVALVAHRSLAIAATAPSCTPSSSRLHDGGAVLQGRGCGRLAVPGQHCARLVRGIALSKCRVHSPGWTAGRTRGGRARPGFLGCS